MPYLNNFIIALLFFITKYLAWEVERVWTRKFAHHS